MWVHNASLYLKATTPDFRCSLTWADSRWIGRVCDPQIKTGASHKSPSQPAIIIILCFVFIEFQAECWMGGCAFRWSLSLSLVAVSVCVCVFKRNPPEPISHKPRWIQEQEQEQGKLIRRRVDDSACYMPRPYWANWQCACACACFDFGVLRCVCCFLYLLFATSN